MKMSLYKVITTLCLIGSLEKTSTLQEDYYWREYTATIPEDAFVAGRDINDLNVYIGQAYVKDKGLIVAEIVPGIRGVHVHLFGQLIEINSYIKILCGPQENFYWARTNSTDAHLFLIGKHPVVGGHVDGEGVLNIGRVFHEGSTKIGRILTYSIENARMYFSHKKEIGVSSYEILLYKNGHIDVRVL